MIMATIQLDLPQEIEEAARSLGLLTSEKLVEMIEAEIQRQRQDAWDRLRATLAPVQASFREDYGHLSDDEALALIDAWIREDNGALVM